jgi:hypothetical protein
MSGRMRLLRGAAGLIFLLTILPLLSCSDSECTGVEPYEGETLTFLFRYCWGHEPEGDCYYTHFWYFTHDSEGARYLGDWYAGHGGGTPPGWWDEAAVGWNCYTENLGCARGSWPVIEDVSVTPRPDQQAEEIALWLSGSLVAPEGLYLVVQEGLASMRQAYGDLVPDVVDLPFKPPWFVSTVEVWLTAEAVEEYERGEYHDLDSLNVALRLSEMRQYGRNWFWLVFEGRLNPERLAEIYGDVESVANAEAPRIVHHGSYLVPWVAGEE